VEKLGSTICYTGWLGLERFVYLAQLHVSRPNAWILVRRFAVQNVIGVDFLDFIPVLRRAVKKKDLGFGRHHSHATGDC